MKRVTKYLLAALSLLWLASISGTHGILDTAIFDNAREQDRLIVVTPKGVTATIKAYEKRDTEWVEVFRDNGYVGRNGVTAVKREGDGATPVGAYRMRRAFGIAEDPGALLPYVRIIEGDLWIDDPASRYYNRLMRETQFDKDWVSAENLARETVAYTYAVIIEYNTDPVVKGAGSAIFLHCSTGRPTNGCVSVPETAMIRLLRFIKPDTFIVVEPSS